MLQEELPQVAARKNRSFASQKLEILPPVMLQASIRQAQTIIFIHIPKTGGSNLTFITEALAKQTPNFQVKRFAVPRVINQSPGLITPGWQGGLKAAAEALKADPKCCDPLNFISGHFPFGLHQSIGKSARYIALIRDPIERAVSSTNFDFQRGYVRKEDASAYLLSSDIDNPQTRMLAGSAYMQDECNEETLHLAKENIAAHFLLLGVAEDTNLFIQILASIQGWGPLALTRCQVTGDKAIDKLSQPEIDALKIKHRYDCLLYEFAKQHWEEWKTKYVVSYGSLTNEKILCISHEFAKTKQTVWLTKEEIEEYNLSTASGLVEVSQKHSGIKESGLAKTREIIMPMEEKVSSSSFRGLGSKTMREKEVREGALSFMSSALLTLIHDYDEGADKETQQLLTHVAGGEQEQAEAMLKTNPLLVFEKGDVTDLSKRSFKNITAFQYALWALDWHMWTMLLAYLPQEEAALQWRELETNSTAHGKHANWQELIDAYAAYPQNNTSKYWIEQIGTKQLLLPAHVVNEYCHEQRGFHPLPDFGSGNKLPRSRVVAGIDWYDADEEWRYPRAQVRSFGAYCFSLGPLFSIQASQPEVSYAEHDRKAIASLLETRQCQRAELAKTLSPLLLTSTHTNPR